MPGPRVYTPRRRLVMQVVMWLILGVTVGLAGLVVHAQQRARRVDLASQAIVEQQISVRLPAKWKQRNSAHTDSRIIVEAVESAGHGRGDARTLRVYRERLYSPMSPLDYLADRFEVRFDVEGDVRESLLRQMRGVRIGTAPGVMVQSEYETPRQPEAPGHKEVIAATVLPSGIAIALKLEGTGALDASDAAIVQQVAAAMTVPQ